MKGRQTRHSKVYTSKGPRDRRVRLAALTAIQFYDVQDRLGFDRPSEAVDWLMLKAKASIEALHQKPNVVLPYSLQGLVNDQEKLRNLQHLGFDSVNTSASFQMEALPELNYPFPVVGSSQLESFLPDSSSCLDQVVFSANLFSKKTSDPVKRSVLSSSLASSMEDAPKKRRVLDWPFRLVNEE